MMKHNSVKSLWILIIAFLVLKGIPHDSLAASRSRTQADSQQKRSTRATAKKARDQAEAEAQTKRESQAVLDRSLRIYDQPQGSTINLFVYNRTAHHVTFNIDFTLRNLKIVTPAPSSIVLAPNQTLPLVQLTRIHLDRPWRYRYNVDLMPGRLRANHDDRVVYVLPYEAGTKHRVVQTYGDGMTHHGEHRYAIDFAMSRGTPVCAARDGIVAAIRSTSNISGKTKDYIDYANYIMIEHDDGTIAEYVHLKQDGVIVKMDQDVKAGEIIGYSGNTGYSMGPHLHFAVRSVTSGKSSKSIPVRYQTHKGILRALEPYHQYQATPLTKNN